MNILNCEFTTLHNYDFIIDKSDKNNNAENLRKRIRKSGIPLVNVHSVYIYTLQDGNIEYPKSNSNTAYIGISAPLKAGLDDRFYHINPDTSKDDGHKIKSNYTLSTYYHDGKKIKLNIMIVNNKESMINIENNLNASFVYLCGSLPIAAGTTSKAYTPKNLMKYTPPCTINCDV